MATSSENKEQRGAEGQVREPADQPPETPGVILRQVPEPRFTPRDRRFILAVAGVIVVVTALQLIVLF